ncbi:MAG: hypothetical protein KGP10_01610 [Actinomycetales bacterium]|nr:hypothetical protein [Actinomycetales bacterium]
MASRVGRPGAPIPATITLVGSSAIAGLAGLMGVSVLVWAVTPHGGASLDDALTTGSAAYLVLHGRGIAVGELHFTVPLIGWLILSLLSIRGTTRWVMNAGAPQRLRNGGGRSLRATHIVISAVATYAVIGGLLAWSVADDSLRTSIGGAAVTMAAIALIGAVWGVAPRGGVNQWLAGISPALARHLRMLPVAVGTIWCAGGLLVLTAAALKAGAIREEAALLDPDPLGIVLLAVLAIAMLPAMAMWASALTVGQGFTVGAQTLISADLVVIGPLPALPWLAALPSAPAGWWWVLLGVPILSGIAITGWLAGTVTSPGRLLAETAAIAASAGLALGVGAGLLSGEFGRPGFGPLGVAALPFGVAASGLICAGGLGAVAVMAADQWLRGRADAPSSLTAARWHSGRP